MIGEHFLLTYLHIILLTLPYALQVNMIVHTAYCQSGVSSTNYSKLCKVTDISAPVLSIATNISVMIIILLKGW